MTELKVLVTSIDLAPESKMATVSFQIDGLGNTGQIVSIRVNVPSPDQTVDGIIVQARSELRAKVLRLAELLGNDWSGWT